MLWSKFFEETLRLWGNIAIMHPQSSNLRRFEETFENPQCDLLQRCYRLNSITWKDDDSNLYKIPSYHLWWCYHQKLLWEINRNLGFCPLGFIPHTVTVMVMVVDMVVGHLPKGRTPANKDVFFRALPQKRGETPAQIFWGLIATLLHFHFCISKKNQDLIVRFGYKVGKMR